jgi:chromosome segregation ATPase
MSNLEGLDIESFRRIPMNRSLILIPALLVIATPALGQTASDSQTLLALLAEVRQLRHDLQTTTVAAQRAQILIYRVQAQESAVRRLQERVDDSRSKLAQIRNDQKNRAATVKQLEEMRDRPGAPESERKHIEDSLAQMKASLEAQANREQEIQATLTDTEDQLRVEQAKLGRLQDELDRLDKKLEDFNRQLGSNPP